MANSPMDKAHSRSASEEIHHIFWNPDVHYSFHNSLQLIPIHSQMNPTPQYFFEINFEVTPHLHLGLLSVSSLQILDQDFVFLSSHACYMSHQSHSPWLHN
jgi:hypothetical protein